MYFTELTETEFANHALNHEQANFLQTPAMKRLLDRRGWDTSYYGVKNDQNQVITSVLIGKKPIKLGFNYLNIDGGFIGDYHDQELLTTFTQGIRDYAEKNNCLYLDFRPNLLYCQHDSAGKITSEPKKELIDNLTKQDFIHQGFADGYLDLYVRWSYVKDLTGLDESSLAKTYSQDARYEIKKTKQFGIKLSKMTYEELPEFEQLLKHTAKRCGFADKSLEYYQILFEEFADQVAFVAAKINFQEYLENIEYRISNLKERLAKIEHNLTQTPHSTKMLNQKREFLAQLQAQENRLDEAQQLLQTEGDQDILLSAAIFMLGKNELLYYQSGTYEKYKKFDASFLIQDAAMRWAVQQGINRYNFYGISGLFDGSDGVLAFKQKFNGYVEELPGKFKLIFKPIKYRLYQTLHKINATVRG